jgi:hypothetical protein
VRLGVTPIFVTNMLRRNVRGWLCYADAGSIV